VNPAALALLAVLLPQPAAPQAGFSPTLFARNLTRVESWRFFEPRAGGAEPDYTFIANRLQFGLRHTGRRWDLLAAGQYVQFGNLPERAFGPGPLGTGGAYFDASGDTASRQAYLKYLSVKLKGLAGGLDVQGGRFGYASGAEAPSGVPKIEAVKRQRVDSRMIGEFEWSLYQRSFDGARVDYRRGPYQVTGAWLRPTQGGFEEEANVHMARVNVETATLNVRPGAWIPHTDAQVFLYRYDDTRSVRARPDNTGRPAGAVDVGITTVGTSLVSARRAGAGELDALLWSAAQFGHWYGDDHGAWAVAAEAGYQWSDATWTPWVRGGLNFSSGDDDPGDDSHGTFFQMLPTARKYSFSAVYTQMNLRDLFAQIILRPVPALSVRADLHRLDLAADADRWYFGSGAIQKSGTSFGFGTRVSSRERALGTILEGSAEYAINPHWSVAGYAGRMGGGAVVKALFADDRLTFAYVESLIQF
jgi:hypothetical protein